MYPDLATGLTRKHAELEQARVGCAETNHFQVQPVDEDFFLWVNPSPLSLAAPR
jgi:hypothetical protein